MMILKAEGRNMKVNLLVVVYGKLGPKLIKIQTIEA